MNVLAGHAQHRKVVVGDALPNVIDCNILNAAREGIGVVARECWSGADNSGKRGGGK